MPRILLALALMAAMWPALQVLWSDERLTVEDALALICSASRRGP